MCYKYCCTARVHSTFKSVLTVDFYKGSMMEIIIILLLMLAGWIQQSDATNCTLHVSSQSLSTVSLHCPNTICQFEVPTLQGDCYTNIDDYTSNCFIRDCNGTYIICDTSQNLLSESSSGCRELSRGGQPVLSNEQPINCTIIVIPNQIIMRCQKGGCNHTARSNSTACRSEIGCDQGLLCSKVFNLYVITPHSNTSEPSETSTAIQAGQCNETVITPSHSKVAATIYSTKFVYVPNQTTVYYTILSTKTIYTSTIVHSSAYPSPCSLKHETVTMQANSLNFTILLAAVSLLIIVLIVLTIGWMGSCWRISKKKNIETRPPWQKISVEMLNLNNNPAYEAQTPLQRNVAYEDTAHSTRKPEESQTAGTNAAEPAYEIIPPTSNVTRLDTQKDDEYDKLNRDIPHVNVRDEGQ